MSEIIDKVPELASPTTNIVSFLVTLISLAVGSYLGALMHRWCHEDEWGKKQIFFYDKETDPDYALTVGDLATVILAIVVILIGSKSHKIVKYIGYGCLVYIVAFEMRELTGKL